MRKVLVVLAGTLLLGCGDVAEVEGYSVVYQNGAWIEYDQGRVYKVYVTGETLVREEI